MDENKQEMQNRRLIGLAFLMALEVHADQLMRHSLSRLQFVKKRIVMLQFTDHIYVDLKMQSGPYISHEPYIYTNRDSTIIKRLEPNSSSYPETIQASSGISSSGII